MEDGQIELDSDYAKKIGFTSDLFSGYLWKQDNTIIISLITSKFQGNGYFIEMLDKIIEDDYNIEVPTPSARMAKICKQYGFKQTTKKDEMFGLVEILTKMRSSNEND